MVSTSQRLCKETIALLLCHKSSDFFTCPDTGLRLVVLTKGPKALGQYSWHWTCNCTNTKKLD